jgi:hypothetical protein
MLGQSVNARPAPLIASTKALLKQFKGTLNQNNRRQNYTLTVSRRGRFSASLTGLQADAALQLSTQTGQVLARSDRSGKRSESIQKTLKPGSYLVRVLQRQGKTNYTLSIRGKPNTGQVNPPTINLFQNLWGEYRGASVTTTGLIDPVTGQFTDGPRAFQTNVTARVRAPLTVGNRVETNPFNLSISSSGLDLGRGTPGAIAVYSALTNSQNLLGQSWQLQYSDNQIRGTLVNANNDLTPPFNDSAPNYLFAGPVMVGSAPLFLASDMNADTTLQGTLTSKELRLRLQGSSGSLRVFVIDIVAQRS